MGPWTRASCTPTPPMPRLLSTRAHKQFGIWCCKPKPVLTLQLESRGRWWDLSPSLFWFWFCAQCRGFGCLVFSSPLLSLSHLFFFFFLPPFSLLHFPRSLLSSLFFFPVCL